MWKAFVTLEFMMNIRILSNFFISILSRKYTRVREATNVSKLRRGKPSLINFQPFGVILPNFTLWPIYGGGDATVVW